MIPSHPARTWRVLPLLAAASAFALAACATTYHATRVEPSGFLGDSSLLQPGAGEQALLVYIRPGLSLASYDKFLIEPVTIWRNDATRDVAEADLQHMADYLHDAVARQLKQDYELVTAAGPGTLRLRLALTEAKGASVVLNVLSTAIPVGRVLSGTKRLATGTHAFVGSAGIEGEITDAVTGERLFAGVDRRAGGKTVRGAASTWDDVYQAFDFWAERIRDRLREYRSK